MIETKIIDVLSEQYDLKINKLTQLSNHNVAATYHLNTSKGEYVLKRIPSSIDAPEEEGKLVKYLHENEISVARIVQSNHGTYTFLVDGNNYHLQEYIRGETFDLNSGTQRFMDLSAQNLGKIQDVLSNIPNLKKGLINQELFTSNQIDIARQSYLNTLRKAQQLNDTMIIEDITKRLEYLKSVSNYSFDYSRLTITNSHGDYYTSQIINKDTKLYTIDWTDACYLPACWEVIMSFAYADPIAKSGEINVNSLKRYVENYSKNFTLNEYDLNAMTYLYFFQLAVSNFYEPYEQLPKEYLEIAMLTTKQLTWLNRNVDSLTSKLV
ncbi:phosphotransferase [Alkalihalobacillus pseudalcaliphilus]|uniref:phosphotransferase n=1 Tax=Alkalihalobacillus pseudalcaliphilus TaxID=79884 RepID=UPI00064DC5E6|nr:phosphotransferase [Alkalihalobacillus pseudalcaliphilus]KMK74988.1 hypothetical protein AB990_16070 [Alkalihalobacillus pseudalcaliphilus]